MRQIRICAERKTKNAPALDCRRSILPNNELTIVEQLGDAPIAHALDLLC
jgi:hypothetical protein